MMLGYVLAIVVSALVGAVAEHHRIVRRMRSEFSQIQKEMCDHLDSMVNKSEIMLRHDGLAFKKYLGSKHI